MATPQVPIAFRGQTTCVYHKRANLDWFCEKCSEPICAECISSVHKSHAIVKLSQETPKHKCKINDFIIETERNELVQLQQEITLTQDSLKKRLDQFESIAKEVEEQGAKLKESVDALIAETLIQLKQLKDEDSKQFDNLLADLQTKLEQLKNQLKQCKKTLQAGTDINVFNTANGLRKNAPSLPDQHINDTLCCFNPNTNYQYLLKQAFGSLASSPSQMLQQSLDFQSKRVPRMKEVERTMPFLIERKDEEINNLKKQLEDQHRRGEQKLKATEKEIGMLRQRLSKVAGAKLLEGNPSFSDPNDPNRPLKLAERYRDLNHNEWTNAFEILTEEKGITRRNAIKLLRNIVTDCYQECVRLAEEQWKTLARVLTMARTENADEIGFRQTEFKDLKNLRKMAATKASDGIVEKVKDVFLVRLENDEEMMQQLRPFLEESIRLTWSMAVQDPPVVMFWDLKQGDPPNDMFKVYTQDGNKVRFVVWPSLLLHEGGPLLAKGVYQLYT